MGPIVAAILMAGFVALCALASQKRGVLDVITIVVVGSSFGSLACFLNIQVFWKCIVALLLSGMFALIAGSVVVRRTATTEKG